MIRITKICVIFNSKRRFPTINFYRYLAAASLYVHWPYCEKRCSYCNFNKYISSSIPLERMKTCIMKETETLIRKSEVKEISSIFFGGGTPTLAKPEMISSVIETVKKIVHVDENIEISMEGNPTSMESRLLGEFKDAGINRFSVGIQALNDHDLRILGRNHTVKESLKSLTKAQRIFPNKTSIDIIFGRPGQSVKSWIKELNEILYLVDGHISLYQLTLERGTSLHKLVNRNQLIVPNDDDMATMYEEAVKILENAGFNRYEVSNFALEGCESLHNISYWTSSEYIGVGPGAHGRFCDRNSGENTRTAYIQTLEPDNWMKEVEIFGHGTRKKTLLSNLDILQEVLALGLRMKCGISEKNWKKFSSEASLVEIFQDSPAYDKFAELDLLKFDLDKNFKATSSGMSVLDSILPDLLLHLKEHFQPKKDI